jgi:hypothetical protein
MDSGNGVATTLFRIEQGRAIVRESQAGAYFVLLRK